MYDQEAKVPQLKFNNLFNEHFPLLIFFFKSILPLKHWQGGEGFLFENGAIDSSAYLPCYFPGWMYITRGPWHFEDFRNIFLPNIGEDQKK